MVGSAPYADAYTTRVRQAAGRDPRILLLGGVWDQDLLDQLYGNCLTYLHGHSVGGTNPSLLRAMGAGADVIAYDVDFNREVLGEFGRYFVHLGDLPPLLFGAEVLPEDAVERGTHFRNRAANRYDWLEVAAGYEQLCKRLDHGESAHGTATGLRRHTTRA